MHLFNMATLFIIVTLVGVEFSVSAFVNPAAWRLDPESQLKMLGRFALVLGRVMPVWYPVCTVLLSDLASLVRLGTQTPACSGCDLGCCFHRIDLFAGSTE